MSSESYSAAEIEAQRKEALRNTVLSNIENMKQQLRENHSNDIQVNACSNFVITVSIEDDALSGAGPVLNVNEESLKSYSGTGLMERTDYDYSELIEFESHIQNHIDAEIAVWWRKISERIILTEKDAQDQIRVRKVVSDIMHDTAMDIGDKLTAIKMRVTSFLDGGAAMTDDLQNFLEDQYLEYCALCNLLGIEATETRPDRRAEAILKYRARLEKKSEQQYVKEVIHQIMEELGCNMIGSDVLDDTQGELFALEGYPELDVFVGSSGSGIMFEPIAYTGDDDSREKEEKIKEGANSLCDMYKEVVRLAAQRGVYLIQDYEQQLSYEDIILREESKRKKVVSTTEGKKTSSDSTERKVKTELKQRRMGEE